MVPLLANLMMMVKIMIIIKKQIFVQDLAKPLTIEREKIIIKLTSNGTKS